MKKTVIIILIIIAIAVISYVWYVRNKKPSLVSFDKVNKKGCYKYQGKTICIDLNTTGVRVAGYTITPILSEVNIENVPIGSIIGIALRKDGIIIDKIVN